MSESLPKEFWRWHPLAELIGDTPAARILQFLSVHRTADYTLKDIARNTHVGYRTFYRYIPKLVRLGVLIESRRIGASKLYRLNLDSSIVKALEKLGTEVALRNAELQREKLVVPA